MTRMAALGLTLFDPRPDLVGFYRFSYPADSTPPDVLESVLAVDEVTGALLDTYIQPFGDPDTYWDQQWNLTKARIDRAWTVATGAGEMVVAIIEPGGVEIEHEDFENAIWVNAIEMNGIPKEDDDRNGFVDDFYGWDFASNDNNPRPTEAGDQHGTAVAGTSSSGMPREQSRTTLR
jgi:subtilisin family serine protease